MECISLSFNSISYIMKFLTLSVEKPALNFLEPNALGDMFTQLQVYLCLTSHCLYLKKTYWRLEDRWLCGGDGLGVMRYGYQVASVFVFDLTVFVFEKDLLAPGR